LAGRAFSFATRFFVPRPKVHPGDLKIKNSSRLEMLQLVRNPKEIANEMWGLRKILGSQITRDRHG
jgi:hypothetical protein